MLRNYTSHKNLAFLHHRGNKMKNQAGGSKAVYAINGNSLIMLQIRSVKWPSKTAFRLGNKATSHKTLKLGRVAVEGLGTKGRLIRPC